MNLNTLRRAPDTTMLLILLIVGGIFFMISNPRHVPPVVLIIGFLIIFGIVFFAVRLTARVVGLRQKLSPGQYRTTIVCLAALPVVLLALQSIGQLTLRDIITILILFGVGYFYASRMSAGNK